MPVDEAYISQYGVIVPSADGRGVLGVVEKPRQVDAPSNLGFDWQVYFDLRYI